MPEIVDDAVVRLEFDNGQYNKGVQESITFTEALKQSINFSGLKDSFSPLIDQTGKLRETFSTTGVIAASMMNRLTNDLVSGAQTIIAKAIRPMQVLLNNLTSVPMKGGMEEYELKMKSVQVMMAATGESIEFINEKLNDLTQYSNLTIYSLKDMTNNIGKFTNAGVKLDVAVNAMKGLMNEAALSGATTQEASRAMYNLAQSLSMGYMAYIDWRSIENANMATIDFKRNLADTAVQLGKVRKTSDGLYDDGKQILTLQQMFKDGLKDRWLTNDILMGTLEKYNDTTTDIGKKAFAAATEMKTFSQMMDTIKEGLQTGWAQSWERLFGNILEAKALWTTVGNALNNLIGNIDAYRNKIIDLANENGFRDNLIEALFNAMELLGTILEHVKIAFEDVFGGILDGKNATQFLITNLTRISEVLKGLSEKFKLTNADMRVMVTAFRALMSVARLVWEVIDQLGYALLDLDERTKPLKDVMRNVIMIASILTMAFVDWIIESDKITSAINFIRNSVLSLGASVAFVFGEITSAKSVQSFFIGIKDTILEIIGFITGIDIPGIDFSSVKESVDGIIEDLKGAEFNFEKLQSVLISLMSVVYNTADILVTNAFPSLLDKLGYIGESIFIFINRILRTMDAKTLLGFSNLIYKIATFPLQMTKWKAIKAAIDAVAQVFGGIADVLRGWGAQMFMGGVSAVVQSIANVIYAFGSIFLNLSIMVGVMVASAWVIKKYKLMGEFVTVFAAIVSFSVALVFLAKQLQGLQGFKGVTWERGFEWQTSAIQYFRDLIISLMAMTAVLAGSAYILKDSKWIETKILSLAASVEAILFGGAAIMKILSDPFMREAFEDPGTTQVMKAFALMLVETLSAVAALSVATRIMGSGKGLDLLALDIAVAGIMAMAAFFTTLIDRMNNVSYLSSDIYSFQVIFQELTAVLLEMVVAVGAMALVSNILKSVGNLLGLSLIAVGLFASLESLYWGLNQLMPLDWKRAGDILTQIGIFLGEMGVAMGVFSLASNLISDVKNFGAGIAGMVVLFAAMEALMLGIEGLGTAFEANEVAVWSALLAMGILGLMMSAMGLVFAGMSGIVTDAAHFFKMTMALSGFFAAMEVILLGALGVGMLIGPLTEFIGTAAVGIALAFLLIFAESMIVVMAQFELLYALVHKDIDSFITFMNSISLFMVALTALGALLTVVGAIIAGSLLFVGPLLLLPIELTVFMLEMKVLESMFGSSMEDMSSLATNMKNMFLNLAVIAEAMAACSGNILPALVASKLLTPFLIVLTPTLLYMATIGQLFALFSGNMVKSAYTVAEVISSFVPLTKSLSEISTYIGHVFKASVQLVALVPIVGIIIAEYYKVCNKIDGKYDYIQLSIKQLCRVFDMFTEDMYNSMSNAVDIFQQIANLDLMNLLKTVFAAGIADKAFSIIFKNEGMFIELFEDLKQFGNALGEFAWSIRGIEDWNAITNGITMIGEVCNASAVLNNTGNTLIGKIFGNNDIGVLGTGLATFGEQLAKFSENVAGVDLSENSPVDKAMSMLERLSKVRVNTGNGLFSLFTGYDNLEVFGKQLSAFGGYLREFSEKLGGTFKNTMPDAGARRFLYSQDLLWDMMEKAIDFIPKVTKAISGYFRIGGVLSLLIGDNSMSALGYDLWLYSDYLKNFLYNVKTINEMGLGLEYVSDEAGNMIAVNDITKQAEGLLTFLEHASNSMTVINSNMLNTAYDTISMIASVWVAVHNIFLDMEPEHGKLISFMNSFGYILTALRFIIHDFLYWINDAVLSLSESISLIVLAFEPAVLAIVGLVKSTLGDTTWISVLTDAIERISAAIKDLTIAALIPLIQNGLIPLMKLKMQADLGNNLVKIGLAIALIAAEIGVVLLLLAPLIAAGLVIGAVIAIIIAQMALIGIAAVTVGAIIMAVLLGVEDKITSITNNDLIHKWLEDLKTEMANMWDVTVEFSDSVFAACIKDGFLGLLSYLKSEWDFWVGGLFNDMDTAKSELADLEGYGADKNTSSTYYAMYRKGINTPLAGMVGDNDELLDELKKKREEEAEEEAKTKSEAYNKYYSLYGQKTEDELAKEREYSSKFAAEHEARSEAKAKAEAYEKYSSLYNLSDEQKSTATKRTQEEHYKRTYKTEQAYKDLTGFINGLTWLPEDLKNKGLDIIDKYYPSVISKIGVYGGDLKSMWSSFESIISGEDSDILSKIAELANGVTNTTENASNKTNAIHEKELLSENAYWAQLLEIRKQGIDGAKYQDMELADFEEEILNHVNEVYDNYINTYYSRLDEFESLSSIFNKVDFGFDPENPFTKEELFGNLQDQITQIDRYSNVMSSLNDRIDTQELRDTINSMGVDSLEELETLNSLTEEELDNYEAMFVSKMESAARAANVVTRDLYEGSMAEIANTIGMPEMPADEIFKWFDGTLDSFDKMMASMGMDFGTVGTNISKGIADGINSDESKAAVHDADVDLTDYNEDDLCDLNEIESPSKRMEREVGVYITAGIAKGMTNNTAMDHIKASVALVVAWYKSEFNEKVKDFEWIGENLMKGLERGINAGSLAASYATGISADDIANVYVRKFGIHSPSTVFEAFGNYLMEGLSIGVKNGTSDAEKTMEQSANSTLGIMQSAVERAYAAMNSESVPSITPVVNMNKLQNGIRTMDTALAAQRSYLMANAANASIDTSVHKEVSINNQAAVDAITRLNGDILNLGDRLANMQIMLDTGIVAGQMAPAMNSELGTLMSRSIREGVG